MFASEKSAITFDKVCLYASPDFSKLNQNIRHTTQRNKN